MAKRVMRKDRRAVQRSASNDWQIRTGQKIALVITLAVAVIALVVVAVSLSQVPVQPAGCAYPCAVASSSTTSITTAQPNRGGRGPFIIEFTDQLHAPNGTTLLHINYTHIKLHELLANGTFSVVNVTGRGTMNLLNLSGTAQTVALVNLSNGALVGSIQFSIGPSLLSIGNESYVMGASEPNYTAAIRYPSNTGILVDLSPAVVQVYSPRYVGFMITSFPIATAIPAQNSSASVLGANTLLSAVAMQRLEQLRANISVLRASMSSSGNVTHISVAVKNNGASPAELRFVQVYGNMFNATDIGAVEQCNPLSLSNCSTGTVPDAAAVVSFEHSYHGVLDLYVDVNGSLELPYNHMFLFKQPNSTTPYYGYGLAPGAVANLSFSGVIKLGMVTNLSTSGPQVQNRTGLVLPITGNKYSIVVLGDSAASAAGRVVAT